MLSTQSDIDHAGLFRDCRPHGRGRTSLQGRIYGVSRNRPAWSMSNPPLPTWA